MNGFWRHPHIAIVQPTYYLFGDPVFFDFSTPSTSFLRSLRQAVTTTTFVAPIAAADVIQRNTLLPHATTHYIATAGILRSAAPFDIDLTRTVPAINNCDQLAILCALYTGCSPIYLLGMDHDWLAQAGPETHFYSGKTLSSHAIAHGQRRDYASQMKDALDLWQGYDVLRQCAKRSRQRIINCTAGGFLDVFERQHYSDVPNLHHSTSMAA